MAMFIKIRKMNQIICDATGNSERQLWNKSRFKNPSTIDCRLENKFPNGTHARSEKNTFQSNKIM